MTERKNNPKRRPKEGYDVGYCKPPEAHRFVKGQCPNRNGRPRKASTKERVSSATIVAEELQREATIRENGKEEKMTLERATIRGLVVRAVKSDKAMALLLKVRQEAKLTTVIIDLPDPAEIAALDPHDAAAAYKRVMSGD